MRRAHAAGLAVAIALGAIGPAACGSGAPRSAPPALAVVGESTRLRLDERLPATTAIFDGDTVRLRGVRGEVLGVQVLRAAPDATTAALAIDGAAVAGFAVDHHDVRQPSTTMYGPSRGRGRYPDRLTPHAGPVPLARAAYFDVAIARDAAPGRHRGELVVGARRIPVELTVEAATLPDLGAAPRVWGYYDASIIARVHGTLGDDAATLALERGYAALFRAHGMVASPEMTEDRWEARKELVAGLAFVPVLLPVEPAALAASVRGWVARLAGTGQVGFAIPIDEPRSAMAQARVRLRARLVRAAGGGPGRFLYAVTHVPTAILGDEIDVYIAPRGTAVPPGSQAWTYNGTPPWAGAMILDTEGAAIRSWGWIAFVHDLPLWYVWDVLFWADRYHRGRDAMPRDLLAEPVTFDDGEDHGNLDGLLAYPGPLPSLRLKALRRGVQDRLLLDALAACRGRPAALAIAGALVPYRVAPEAAWEAARRRILDGLVGCDRR